MWFPCFFIANHSLFDIYLRPNFYISNLRNSMFFGTFKSRTHKGWKSRGRVAQIFAEIHRGVGGSRLSEKIDRGSPYFVFYWIFITNSFEIHLRGRGAVFTLPFPPHLPVCIFKLLYTVIGFERTGGRLTKIQLIEIVFYQLIKTLLISWPNFLTLFSWSKLLIMISVKRLNFRRLTEFFYQLPKSVGSF